MPTPLVQRILRFIRQNGLLKKGDKVLAAVSGGADSTALLLLFRDLKRLLGLEIGVAHFNHGLRGKESDRDALFVKKLCKTLDTPLFLKKSPVKKRKGQSPEETAREARLEFLERTARENGFAKIATAHHQDDQAETVLMRLLTGSGLSGLKGIRARNGKFIRPLLAVSKEEILSFLKSCKQPFCTDRTNAQVIFLRNRIRLRLIPFLKKEFGFHVVRTLARLAENVQAGVPDLVLKTALEKELSSFGPITLSSSNMKDLKYKGTANLPGGRIARRLGFQLSTIPNHPGIAYPAADENRAFFDADRMSGLVLRHRKPGDVFHPLGAAGPKKLKSFLIDQKVPVEKRDQLLLLESGGRIAWVAGVRIADPFKVSPATAKILVVKIPDKIRYFNAVI